MMSYPRYLIRSVLGLLVFVPPGVMAQDLPYQVVSPGTLQPGDPIPVPQKRPVLTIRGRIGVTQDDGAILFDIPTLETLGLIRFTTPTAWTDAPVTFEGVLAARLLEVVAASPEATEAVLTALNDYHVTIPLAEFRQWPIMIALKRDGKYMSVRAKGPLWLVYPRHAFPELVKDKYHPKWIWQLQEIVIR